MAATNGLLDALMDATRVGTAMVFGYLGGGALPYDATHPEATFVLATQALPLILVVSALSALLFHWGVLTRLVQAFAWILQRTMGISGAVGRRESGLGTYPSMSPSMSPRQPRTSLGVFFPLACLA